MKKKQPMHQIVIKLVWFTALIIGLIATVFFFIDALKTEKDSSGLMVAFEAAGTTIFIVAFVFIPIVFKPEIESMRANRELYTIKQTQNLQEEYSTKIAGVNERAVRKRASAVKSGIEIEFCSNCGDKIEAGEIYCNKCGTHLVKVCEKCNNKNGSQAQYCKNCGEKLGD